MPTDDHNLRHYGPEPHHGIGAEAVHAQIHGKAIGKTIARVYLGDCKPIDDLPQSEYVVLEFTDGSALMLEVGAGYSFSLGSDKEATKVVERAKS